MPSCSIHLLGSRRHCCLAERFCWRVICRHGERRRSSRWSRCATSKGLLMNGILQDVRFSLRQLSKNLGFACTAVFVLAMGLAASTAIFAFVDAALIKPLPYSDPTRLVDVTESVTMIPRANLSYPDYRSEEHTSELQSRLHLV